MVLLLIIFTLAVYLVLWFGDIHLTLKTVRTAGTEVEINPIFRNLFRFRRRYFWFFKALEMIAFLYLIFYLTFFSSEFALYPLLVYIVIYAAIFANNSRVHFLVTHKDSRLTYAVFIFIALMLAVFIYLNYTMFQDLSTSYDKIFECKSQLSDALARC